MSSSTIAIFIKVGIELISGLDGAYDARLVPDWSKPMTGTECQNDVEIYNRLHKNDEREFVNGHPIIAKFAKCVIVYNSDGKRIMEYEGETFD